VRSYADQLAANGYRTLGLARTDAGGCWCFLGLLPLFDRPQTVERVAEMELSVRMITSDHTAIAREIARKLKTREHAVEAAWAVVDPVLGTHPGLTPTSPAAGGRNKLARSLRQTEVGTTQ
jgi:magnesium-transporting ATPase (P-type)